MPVQHTLCKSPVPTSLLPVGWGSTASGEAFPHSRTKRQYLYLCLSPSEKTKAVSSVSKIKMRVHFPMRIFTYGQLKTCFRWKNKLNTDFWTYSSYSYLRKIKPQDRLTLQQAAGGSHNNNSNSKDMKVGWSGWGSWEYVWLRYIVCM